VLNPDRLDDDTVFKALGRAYHVRILLGRDEFYRAYAPMLEKSDFGDELVVTIKQIRAAIEAAGWKPKGNSKEPLMDQLAEIDPSVIIWDREVEDHAKLNAYKILFPQKAINRIEIANAMIEKDTEISKAFKGGHAEVALFWYCEDEVQGRLPEDEQLQRPQELLE
jgi:hypothetical protein